MVAAPNPIRKREREYGRRKRVRLEMNKTEQRIATKITKKDMKKERKKKIEIKL